MSTDYPPPVLQFTDNTLRIEGEADAISAGDLRQRGEAMLAAAEGDIRVDLSRLASANSALLSVFLCWQRFASQHALNLRFDHPGERLLALAALANLESALPGFEAAGQVLRTA